jgi:hypothetical protein
VGFLLGLGFLYSRRPQKADPEHTIYRHFSSDRIIGHARKDGTIGWVDSFARFLYFEVEFSVLGYSRLASYSLARLWGCCGGCCGTAALRHSCARLLD